MTNLPPSDPPSGGWSANPAQPGWHPDPAGRNEHRYWDGTQWTEHVANQGVESVDPLAGGPPQAAATASYGAMGGPPGADPFAGGGPGPPGSGQPPKSGPSPALLVALGLLVVAVIVGVIVIVSQDDDGDDTAGTTTTTTTTAEDDSTTTTGGDTTETSASSGDSSESAIVSLLAEGMLDSAGGAITRDEATCIAEGMVDVLGTERIFEASQSGEDAFQALTPSEQAAVTEAMLQCVDAQTLAEIGANS